MVFANRPLSLPALIYGLVLAAVLLWTGSHLFPPINLDVGALLYVAKRWLAGDRLYVDVIDVNTPWAIALHVPAEFTAAHLGLDGPTWFSIYVIAAVLISVALVALLARRFAGEFGSLTARTLPLLTLFVLGVDPGHGFGQREHLLVIATVPYLVLAALRATGAEIPLRLRLIVAAIAGLGFAIKPYFLLPLLLVEAYLLFARGPRAALRDPVPWTIAALLLLHVVFALLVTPEYFSLIVPFAAAVYSDPLEALSHSGSILLGPQLGPVMVLLPVLALIAFIGRMPLARILSLFVAGAAMASAAQGKGWDYHSLPALDGALLLTVVVITKLIERYSPSGLPLTVEGSRILAACLVLPFLFQDGLRLQPFRDQLQFNNSAVHQWLAVMGKGGANGRALVLSAGMYPQFPAMNYAHFKMAMPFLTMWPLYGLYGKCKEREQGYRAIEAQTSQESFFFHEVVDGFVEEQPDILVVDKFAGMRDCSGKPFEYLPYFMRDRRFAKAFLNYRPLATLGQYSFFERVPNLYSGPADQPREALTALAKAGQN